MTVNTHYLVPGDTELNPFTIPGTTRTYACAAGAIIAVPEFDALILRNAGWVATNTGNAGGSGGPTASRPVWPAMDRGFRYIDTTLGAAIVFAGRNTGWVNEVTGAIV